MLPVSSPSSSRGGGRAMRGGAGRRVPSGYRNACCCVIALGILVWFIFFIGLTKNVSIARKNALPPLRNYPIVVPAGSVRDYPQNVDPVEDSKEIDDSQISPGIVDVSSDIDDVDDDSKNNKPTQNPLPPSSTPKSDISACISHLEKVDTFPILRNFDTSPIKVGFKPFPREPDCDIPCQYESPVSSGNQDGLMSSVIFGGASALTQWNKNPAQKKIILGMESATNYPTLQVPNALRSGYDIVMTTSLDSHVPAPYCSWVEYAFYSPLTEKTEQSMAAAYISNCGTGNAAKKRLQVLKDLMDYGVTVDSYGGCLHNKAEDRSVPKGDQIRKYKFTFAMENTYEEDYATEKLFQAFDAGSVPIVIAPKNAHDFEPSPNSMLFLDDFENTKTLADRMKYLDSHPEEYAKMVQWKIDGPSKQFRALVDLSSVHSRCRLCVLLGDGIREQEWAGSPSECVCSAGGDGQSVYHLFVRERSTFNYRSIYLTELSLSSLTASILSAFRSTEYAPVWAKQRPGYESGVDLTVYGVYPSGITQRKALYGGGRFEDSHQFASFVLEHPCPRLEVIFV